MDFSCYMFNLILQSAKEYEIHYLYASRRALRVPLLTKYSHPSLEAIAPTRYISVCDLISSIGLEPSDYDNIIANYGFKGQDVVEDCEIEANPKLNALLGEIWPDVLHNAENELASATAYLRSREFKDQFAIIDIGWRGSMQRSLQQLLEISGIKAELTGYYITLSSSMFRGQEMYGYLQNVNQFSPGCDLLRGYVGLIETLFLKQEGSVSCYQQQENGVARPVLEHYEYSSTEHQSELFAVCELQNGALRFIEDLCRSDKREALSFSSEGAFQFLSSFANYPTNEALRMFGDFHFFNNGTVSTLAGARPVFVYIIHPREAKKDLYKSRWRVGFLKKMLFIPLPYYSIFRLMMKATK